MATIHFTLSDLSEGSKEVRSAGRVRMKPEMVVVPVEGDCYMYATQEEAEEPPLRSPGSTLDVGTHLRIVAYTSADAYVSDFEYEVTDVATGAIKPVGAPSGLTLTAGSYRFVAYSLNTASVPVYAPSISSDGPYSPNGNASDPLWGISGTVNVVEGINNVSIAMKHQFSLVAITATTTDFPGTAPAINAMSAALLGYKASAMNALTGALTKGEAEDQTFGTFSTLGATTVTCPHRMVYAGGESITSVKITSARVGGTTRGGLVARFNHQLEAGKSYTLKISFQKLQWARSNIYWDTATHQLTFAPAGSDVSKEGYQGVFFKWGSLVGISPAGGWAEPFTNSTPVYKAGESASSTYSSWAAIPYWDRDTYGDVIDDSHTGELRGDICRYLNAAYRLPKAGELASTGANTTWSQAPNGWVKGGTPSNGSGNAYGTYDIIGNGYLYAENVPMGNVRFPGSGERNTSGALYFVGTVGEYWSDAVAGADPYNAYYFYYNNGNFYPSGNSEPRYIAFPVRCVKN
jgi:hypothetical protein